jgi:hypothetical protein
VKADLARAQLPPLTRAEISLDLLAGYASFVPTRHLKRWERAGISFAGPAIQIAVSMLALWAMGVYPLYPGYGASDAARFGGADR